jgi:hypothetical protein
MKYRQGFVSNSSTSSFLIYGIELDSSEFYEKLEKEHKELVDKALDKAKKVLKDEKNEELAKDLSFQIALQECLISDGDIHLFITENKLDIPFYTIDEEYGLAFFGESPQTMDDNTTKKKWKEQIEKKINKYMDKKTKCEWISHEFPC